MESAKALVILRIVSALLVIIIAGCWGFFTLFSDPPSGQSFAAWVAYVLAGHIVAGFVVGVLMPLRWKWSIAAGWGSILMGSAGLIAVLRKGGLESTPDVPLLSRAAVTILALALAPAAAGISGYAGSRVMRRARNGGATP